MFRPFQSVGGSHPHRSIFNLSYSKKFTCDMGQIIPICCEECIPGDIWKIGNNNLIRFNPLVAPILHEVKVKTDYFFVPYRLLWNKWESFYTRGRDGKLEVPLPTWIPETGANLKGTLWDFLGFPISISPYGAYPLTFPRDAYYYVYNEYYRDQNLMPRFYTDTVNESNVDDTGLSITTPTDVTYPILDSVWSKDYFTSALPFEQRGNPVAVPLQGYGSISFTPNTVPGIGTSAMGINPVTFEEYKLAMVSGIDSGGIADRVSYLPYVVTHRGSDSRSINFAGALTASSNIDLSSLATFTVNELRFAFQLQKYYERSARGGYRYIETLRVMFGVSPSDSRLQRPEYIGGTRSHLFFSEVLQTSSTDSTSPQANMSGHGISAPSGFAGRYKVTEFGLILGLMRLMPTPSYQQGIKRSWLRRVNEDYYNPLFANLGEQAITLAEIYAVNQKNENNDIFGFQGRWDELRYNSDMVCSDMRDVFDYWHLSRKFGSRPYLNKDFLTCNMRTPSMKRIFAVQNVPGVIVNFGNVLSAARPMPVISEPGLVDHH